MAKTLDDFIKDMDNLNLPPGGLLACSEKPDVDLVFTSKGQKFYLGSMPESYDELEIEVAISCVNEVAENENLIDVLQIPFQDSWYVDDQPTEEQLRRWLKTMHCLIDGRDVLIHCHAGMNRSALMMVLYLYEYHSSEFTDKKHIVEHLRSKRHPLLQNSFFEIIIENWK